VFLDRHSSTPRALTRHQKFLRASVMQSTCRHRPPHTAYIDQLLLCKPYSGSKSAALPADRDYMPNNHTTRQEKILPLQILPSRCRPFQSVYPPGCRLTVSLHSSATELSRNIQEAPIKDLTRCHATGEFSPSFLHAPTLAARPFHTPVSLCCSMSALGHISPSVTPPLVPRHR
jgi:hypothetical protein